MTLGVGQLRIGNWNVERVEPSQHRAVAVRRHLASVDADIWFLTETHEGVVPGDSFHHHFSGEPDRSARVGERWVGLWTRYEMEPLLVSDPARCAAAHLTDSPLGEIVLHGCVLPWSTEWRGIPGAGGQAFEAALNLQRADWSQMRTQFPSATLVVAGDFNQDLAAKHYYGSKRKRTLLEGALRDAKLVPLTAGPNDPIARDSAPYACIDHICVSESAGWQLNSTARWPDTPAPLRNSLSDHFGVVVEVSSR
jgi:hypothetical protein